ncbi:MAG: DUF2188 domain-containing protein [Planctomycetes bacterium]|nr:DUF2188 domain-containing protein [Planctomycetota bacterium]MCB9936570.1 DUF2188 domain-containing protein [Planctomycetota bacterium]
MASTFTTEMFVKLFGVMPAKPGPAPEPRKAPKTEVLVPNRAAQPGEKIIYHVTPRNDQRWGIRKEGGSRPSAVCENKDEAVERAREIARNLPWSQVIIHNMDGKIAQEFSYGGPRETGDSGEWEPEETDIGLEMTEIPTDSE